MILNEMKEETAVLLCINISVYNIVESQPIWITEGRQVSARTPTIELICALSIKICTRFTFTQSNEFLVVNIKGIETN